MGEMSMRATRRSVRLGSALAAAAGVASSAVMVWHASYAAFSASTANPASGWAAGTVVLADDDADTALFTATGLAPGGTDSRCIAVTSTGSLPSAVRLYGTGYASSNNLAAHLSVTISQGSGGGAGSCTGFTPLGSGATVYTGTVAGFAATATDYATGQGNWTPTGTGSDTRVFRFSYTLDPATPNTSQAGTASLGFTWEAQNT
jgi:hypothetical protein